MVAVANYKHSFIISYNYDCQTATKAESAGSGQSCIGKPSSSGSVIAQVVLSMIAGNQGFDCLLLKSLKQW